MFNFKFKNMKNLENYGVQELSKKETLQVEGGSLLGKLIAAAIFIIAAVFLSEHNDNVQF
jgi:predicted outer membrane lipoprotein